MNWGDGVEKGGYLVGRYLRITVEDLDSTSFELTDNRAVSTAFFGVLSSLERPC